MVAWRIRGFEASDTGIAAATGGLAGVRVVRAKGAQAAVRQSHDTELCFYYVLSGTVTVELDGGPQVLAADDSIAIPGGMTYALADASADLTLLDITLPGDVGEIGPTIVTPDPAPPPAPRRSISPESTRG